MINEPSIAAVNASKLNEHFAKPLYESYCFSRIPQTVTHLLTGEGDAGLPDSVLGELPRKYKKVIVLFVDAFGWRFFDRYYEKYPFLKRFAAEGVVSKLTTQFPSTTAAHTTTIHTGLTPDQSGVYEWFYYEPTLDRIIAPLLFSFSDDRERNTLQKLGVLPETLYPTNTVYQRLKAKGVKSYVFQHRDYTPSPFSDTMFSGSKVLPFKTLSEAFTNLTEAVLQEKNKAYYFMYYDAIDTIGHGYGPSSKHFDAEVDTFLTAIEKLLYSNLQGELKDTLLLVTADHGQMDVFPERTALLNQMEPSLNDWIKTNQEGRLLIPAGSARDMFLYIKDEHLDEAQARLTEYLKGKAEVCKVAELIAQGFFGTGESSPVFLGRAGNLVILPYKNEAAWWLEKGGRDTVSTRFRGAHGGLSPEEMHTVLLALPFC